MLLAVAAAILLSASDPQGDAYGDGGYVLPQGVNEASLDIRSFTAQDNGGKLQLRVNLASLENSEAAPLGFTQPVLDVFVRTPSQAGDETLGDTGFTTPSGRGWRYHLHLTGFQASLQQYSPPAATPTGSSPASGGVFTTLATPRVHVEGATIIADTDLPAAAGEYWVFTRLYTPLSPGGVQAPVPVKSAFNLYSDLDNAPSPLDVLASGSQARFWATRQVPPVGNEPNRAPYLLLAGLIGACLALGATIWSLFTRR